VREGRALQPDGVFFVTTHCNQFGLTKYESSTGKRLFICSFVRLFVCSFVRSFVRLFVCLFVFVQLARHTSVGSQMIFRLSSRFEVIGSVTEYI